jgi:hypothetical protein
MALPWRQKIAIAVIFSLGIYVILAAILTKIFNLKDVYNPGCKQLLESFLTRFGRRNSLPEPMSQMPWPHYGPIHAEFE